MDGETAVSSPADPQTSSPEESAEDRILRIRTELWVPYPEATGALATMTRLLNAPNETRPESFALIGDPSYGKSYLLKRFVRRNAPVDLQPDEEPTVPIVHIDMPESPEPAAMLREILAKLGAVFSFREPVDELMRKIMVLTVSLQIRVFVIDEFHNGFQGTHRQQTVMLNITRGLTNRTQRPLIVAGTDGVDSFLQNDTQLSERFIRCTLRKWKNDKSTQSLLKGFGKQIGLRNESRLGDDAMSTLIIELTQGKLGRISRLVVLAAEEAIRSGSERIDEALLRKIAKELPGRRPGEGR